MEIVNKLQEKRVEEGLTRPQLAEKAGVSWETIKAYEVKGALPSLTVALKIAETLKCKVEDIFSYVAETAPDLTAEVEIAQIENQ